MLEDTGRAGERKRVHESYLKCSVFCGECQLERGASDSRLNLQRTTGRTGTEHYYFFCIARQQGAWDSRHIPMHEVDEAVLKHCRTVRLSDEFIRWVEESIDSALADHKRLQNELRGQLTVRLNQIATKADNLIDLVAEGGTVAAKASARIRDIEDQRRAVEQQLGTMQDGLAKGVAQIRGWIEPLRDPCELYLNASDEMRRRLNQAIFHRLWVIDLNRVSSHLSEPAQLLLEAQMALQREQFEQAPMQGPRPPTADGDLEDEAAIWTYSMHDGNGSSEPRLVDLRGLEPLTPCMPCRCATSCATDPWCFPARGGTAVQGYMIARGFAAPRRRRPCRPGCVPVVWGCHSRGACARVVG